MQTLTVITVPALVYVFVQFLRYCTNGDTNAIVTQVCAWAAGIGAVFLFAQSDWAASIGVGDVSLEDLNGYSLLIVGVGLASIASVGNDLKKAIDKSDSAKVPPLIPPQGD